MVSAAGAEGCRAAGVGDPDPAERQLLAVDRGRDATSYELLVERRETQSCGTAGEPLEVAGQREGLTVDDLDRLEDTVTHGEAVVGHRDRWSIGVVEQFSVNPGAHGPNLSAAAPGNPGFCLPLGFG